MLHNLTYRCALTKIKDIKQELEMDRGGSEVTELQLCQTDE